MCQVLKILWDHPLHFNYGISDEKINNKIQISWDNVPLKPIKKCQIAQKCSLGRTRPVYLLSVTAHIIALLHVGLINVVYLTACAFIRSS